MQVLCNVSQHLFPFSIQIHQLKDSSALGIQKMKFSSHISYEIGFHYRCSCELSLGDIDVDYKRREEV